MVVPHARIIGWLGHYEAETPGVAVADNATARLDLDNEPQPDAMLYIDPERGGQVRIGPEDYIEAAPELVVEVASSSVSFDLNTKLHVYRRSGVQEYIVWRVLDSRIDWFVLRSGVYERLAADDGGVVRSERFPGLWLNTRPCCKATLPRRYERWTKASRPRARRLCGAAERGRVKQARAPGKWTESLATARKWVFNSRRTDCQSVHR